MEKYLSDYDGRRDNNFTLIRILFAWAVLYGHSYAIQKVPGIKDPLNSLFMGSIWVGEIAVNGFFAISGYLVAASFIRRGVWDYAISRSLRIFPALFVCVFVSVFLIGPLLGELSVLEYLSNSDTYSYLRNSLAVSPMKWTLPGVFEGNINHAVNGSLWTLTVEVRCYILLAVIGFLGAFKSRVMANFVLLAIFVFAFQYFSDFPLLGRNAKWARPGLYFLLGILFYVNRDKVLLNFRLACASAIMLFASFGKDWFGLVFPLVFVYLIFYLAYCSKFIDIDRRVGDISYGIYIYAWPVQQIVAQFFPGSTPYFNTAVSTLIVVPLAYFSWHFIESPALSKKV